MITVAGSLKFLANMGEHGGVTCECHCWLCGIELDENAEEFEGALVCPDCYEWERQDDPNSGIA